MPPLYQNGVVFELSPTGTETVLYTFTGGEDGGVPYSNLIRDNAGNLYGTNTWNGNLGIDGGFIYKIDPTGKETTLHGFGYPPNAPLITDGKGAIYGTLNIIPAGDQDDGGILWKFDSTGYHVLYTFPPVSGFLGGLALDADGNVYGTTGATENSSGTIYELAPGGQFSTVYHFQGSLNGESPNSVIVSPQGNILGTTQIGGSGNVGGIFRITSAGAESLIYNFPQQDGCASYAGLIADAQGNLYGTTLRCGTAGQGTVFKIDNQGIETVLYSFQGGTDGANPTAELIRDQSGNLYGTTSGGGANDAGTIFRLSSARQETILHSFGAPGDGVNPSAGLTADSAGDLYGTTIYGGASNGGTVFELSSSGTESVLYSFTGGNDGGFPASVLIRDSAGNLFGTAAEGAVQSGVIFKVDPAGVETVLYSFEGAIANDGAYPNSTFTVDSAGNLYGTTSQGGAYNGGTVFKLTSHGRESVLYSFNPTSAYGSDPEAGVIRDSVGNLYGTASGRAPSGFAAGTQGVVYKLSPTGVYTVLYSFSGSMDDSFPGGKLLAGPGGVLYGTNRGQFVFTQVDPQGTIVLDEFGGEVFALKPTP